MDLLAKTRWFSLASMLAAATLAAPGCAVDPVDDHVANSDDGSSKNDITQVNHSKVKRQSIGNCWLYATASWLESLNKAATDEEANTSESWLTYWHWFDQIANGGVSDEIKTGGSYSTAANLIARYGLINEADFIPSEGTAEMSYRQKSALDAINVALKTGALSTPAARRDRAVVRAALDQAWGLRQEQRERIDAVFGAGVTRTLDRSQAANDAAAENLVIRAEDFAARLKDPQTGEFVTGSLADALGKSSGWYGPRTGKYAWNEVDYPTSPTQRRAFWRRVQKALHDGQPVITSWKVDFNALTRESRFSKAELDLRGPGSQGGHMTVMHDYQAEIPGYGVLEAGAQADPEELEALLEDDTIIEFVRVKNSWGGLRPDRWDDSIIPGYHDLELAYLNGPIQACPEDANGTVDKTKCTPTTPLWDVVLPAGY